MKKLLILAFTGLTCLTVSATIFEADPAIFFKKATEYEESGIGLELINKSKRPIWIVARNGEELSRPLKVNAITPKYRQGIRLKLDISKPTQLAVWYSDPGTVEYKKTKLLGLGGKPSFVPAPNKLYTFTKNKTLYLTWDEANYARPQSGPKIAFGKKTDSNLSLKRNVKKEDIKEAAPTSASS